MNLIKFRLVNIFTAESKTETKEAVSAEFCHSDTKLHWILTTCAFELGIDCSDIARIIHWGPPNTLELF